jgi:RND family efflux transporter MFP subunit
MKNKFLGLLQLVLVVAFISGAVGLSLFLASMQDRPIESKEITEREIVVSTQEIRPREHRIEFKTTGSVDVRSTASITPQVSGKVASVSENFYPGGTFRAGETLFTIEPSDYLNEVKRLNAEIASAKTRLELVKADAQAAVEEWEELNPDKEVPPLVAKKPQIEQAEMALQAAQAQVETAKLNLKRTVYSLPYAGRVTSTSIEPGQFVAAGQSIGQAYVAEALEVTVPLDDKQMAWLLEAKKPKITVSAEYLSEKREFKAEVKRIGAERDPLTRFGRVVLSLKNPDTDLVPGVFVDVSITGARRANIWRLPLIALQEDNAVWIVESGKLRKLSPEIILTGEDYALAGSDGTAIDAVINSLSGATEGTSVRIMNTQEGGK